MNKSDEGEEGELSEEGEIESSPQKSLPQPERPAESRPAERSFDRSEGREVPGNHQARGADSGHVRAKVSLAAPPGFGHQMSGSMDDPSSRDAPRRPDVRGHHPPPGWRGSSPRAGDGRGWEPPPPMPGTSAPMPSMRRASSNNDWDAPRRDGPPRDGPGPRGPSPGWRSFSDRGPDRGGPDRDFNFRHPPPDFRPPDFRPPPPNSFRDGRRGSPEGRLPWPDGPRQRDGDFGNRRPSPPRHFSRPPDERPRLMGDRGREPFNGPKRPMDERGRDWGRERRGSDARAGDDFRPGEPRMHDHRDDQSSDARSGERRAHERREEPPSSEHRRDHRPSDARSDERRTSEPRHQSDKRSSEHRDERPKQEKEPRPKDSTSKEHEVVEHDRASGSAADSHSNESLHQSSSSNDTSEAVRRHESPSREDLQKEEELKRHEDDGRQDLKQELRQRERHEQPREQDDDFYVEPLDILPPAPPQAPMDLAPLLPPEPPRPIAPPEPLRPSTSATWNETDTPKAERPRSLGWGKGLLLRTPSMEEVPEATEESEAGASDNESLAAAAASSFDQAPEAPLEKVEKEVPLPTEVPSVEKVGAPSASESRPWVTSPKSASSPRPSIVKEGAKEAVKEKKLEEGKLENHLSKGKSHKTDMKRDASSSDLKKKSSNSMKASKEAEMNAKAEELRARALARKEQRKLIELGGRKSSSEAVTYPSRSKKRDLVDSSEDEDAGKSPKQLGQKRKAAEPSVVVPAAEPSKDKESVPPSASTDTSSKAPPPVGSTASTPRAQASKIKKPSASVPTSGGATSAGSAKESEKPVPQAPVPSSTPRKVAKTGGASSPRSSHPRAASAANASVAAEPFVPTPAMVLAKAAAVAAPKMPSAEVPVAQSSLVVVLSVLQENAQRAAKARERVAGLDAVWRPKNMAEASNNGKTSDFQGQVAPATTRSEHKAMYRRPCDAPGWKERDAAWQMRQPALMVMVRARQLESRRYVAALVSRYEEAQHAWHKEASKWKKKRDKSEGALGGAGVMQSLSGGRRASHRGASSGGSSFLGDGIIRSDYEQEMLLKELSREESLRLRIEKGTIDAIPPMLFAPTLKHLPLYDDESNALVTDPAADEVLRRAHRPWTDLEKCIFLDKFLQFPKNFGKVASFLEHKTAKDCVRFYYDSKKDIDYKAVLREHQQRRRGLRQSWNETAAAAECCGAVVASMEPEQDAEFAMPQDGTYATANRHPPHAPSTSKHGGARGAAAAAAGRGGPSSSSKRARDEAWPAAESEKDWGIAATSSEYEPPPKKDKSTGLKWTAAEKDTFYRAYQTHGKDWATIMRLLPNKNELQIKNYYQNYKNRLNLREQSPPRSSPHASPPPLNVPEEWRAQLNALAALQGGANGGLGGGGLPQGLPLGLPFGMPPHPHQGMPQKGGPSPPPRHQQGPSSAQHQQHQGGMPNMFDQFPSGGAYNSVCAMNSLGSALGLQAGLQAYHARAATLQGMMGAGAPSPPPGQGNYPQHPQVGRGMPHHQHGQMPPSSQLQLAQLSSLMARSNPVALAQMLALDASMGRHLVASQEATRALMQPQAQAGSQQQQHQNYPHQPSPPPLHSYPPFQAYSQQPNAPQTGPPVSTSLPPQAQTTTGSSETARKDTKPPQAP